MVEIEYAKDCPHNVSEDSCPNCEREDCPIDRNIQRIMGMPKKQTLLLKKFLLQKIDDASLNQKFTKDGKE